ncbi:hypothetical protein BH11BAC2_BH11BAC2_10950 [soil metagenome]
MTSNEKFNVRLGLFVTTGITIFVMAIFFIGKQKNLFNPVFRVSVLYKNVNGLQTGNNVRFSGINVGTVDDIVIINDSMVKVDIIIQKEVQKFIKKDSKVVIGSDGIIGDRILNITQGSVGTTPVKENDILSSEEPIETESIMKSLKATGENAEVATGELAEILFKINKGNGTLGRLIQDSTIAENIDQTIANLKSGTQGLSENMEAAKHNILLKGYFKKKDKKAAEKLKEEADKKEQEQKDKEKKKEDKN